MDAIEIMEGMVQRLDHDGLGGLDRQIMMGLAERHFALAKAGRPDEAEHFIEVDTKQYVDPALFEREKRAIFERTPIVAGLSQDIPNPGDYVTVDHAATPMIVIRTKSGAAKAFLNGCRHRGAGLIYDTRGTGKTGFACPYHGWSYDLEGKLVSVPCAPAFEGLDRSRFGLVELPIQELGGILFVSPKPDVPLDLDKHLGPDLIRELSSWGFDQVTAAKSEPIFIKGNWKLVFETFLESYHFAAAHHKNLAQFYNCNVHTVDAYNKNLRISISIKTILDELEPLPADQQVPENYVHVSYILFPGMVLINTTQVLEMFRIFPKSVDETVVEHACYSRMPLDEGDNRAMFEMIWANAHGIVQAEDFPFGAISAHKAIASGALKTMVFGQNELPIHLTHAFVDEAIKEFEAG